MDLALWLQIGQIAALVIGAAIYIIFIKADFKILKNSNEANFTIVKHDINIMKLRADSQSETLKQLTAILSTVAVQDNRLNNLEEDIRELKHGEGYILPLLPSARNPSGGSSTG